MRFVDLVSFAKVYKKGMGDLLVILPMYTEYDVVFEHLHALAKQNFTKFDLLVVMGDKTDEKKVCAFLESLKAQFGIIAAKRKENTGPAGGFCTGQKYALENGYGYVLQAESDCVPDDPDTVGKLYENRAKRYVAPVVRLPINEKESIFVRPSNTSHYTLIDTGIFRKYGLYFMPAFYGSDDGEFMDRVKEKREVIDVYVRHPQKNMGDFVFRNLNRTWFYILQILTMRKPGVALAHFFYFATLICAWLFFAPKGGAMMFLRMNRLLFTYSFGRRASEQIDFDSQSVIVDAKSVEAEKLAQFSDSDASYIRKGVVPKLLLILRSVASNYRKDLLILRTTSYIKSILVAVVARKAYFLLGGERLLVVTDNKNALVHAAKLVLFAIFLPAYCIVAWPVFAIVKIVAKPKTYKYGLD